MELLSKVSSFIKGIGKGKLTRIVVFSVLIIILAVVTATFLNQKTYSVLYSGMEAEDAGEVLQVLTDMGIDAKPRGSDTILVEASQADTIRMQLSAQGYPNSGVNFDIFQNASGLGATDMDKNVYYQFQLQENIRRTIIKMDKVEDAVVNLNLSEESSFVLSDDDESATAAVMLMLKGGQTISNSEVRAIAELVSKSIAGLTLENVRIIDSQMNLYSIDDETEIQSVNSQMDLQNSVQTRLKDQIINLLTPVFGSGNVIAEVNVILDFDKQVTESVVFTPPVEGNTGIVISMQELSETIKNYEDSGVVGIESNGSGSTYTTDDQSNDVYEKVTKEANMEINETKTLIENAKGTIKELSVSVILDSSNSTYDYTENVKQLVSNAIGVSDGQITVEMLPFKKMENTEIQDAFSGQKEILESVQKTEVVKYIIIALAALLILVLLSAIIRSITDNSVNYEDYEQVEEYEEYEIRSEASVKAANATLNKSDDIQEEEIEIDFEKKDTTLDQLGKYINKSPESVAQLLRKWLYEDFGK